MKEIKNAMQMINEAYNISSILYDNKKHYYVGLCKEIISMIKFEENDYSKAIEAAHEALDIFETFFKNNENKPVARIR